MLMPKKNRYMIYEYLFKEGVLVAKKDFHQPKHPELDVPNLQVIKTLQSLKSKGWVNEQFAWRHYYWYLTNDGIEKLRGVLNIPDEIVPSTLKRQARTTDTSKMPRQLPGQRSEGGRGGEDRSSYRRGPPGVDKKADVGAGSTEVEFKGYGGFGRGKAPPQ
uniref:40S ribosomal protein S10 n=1 Tax=Cacopsylla melanoneura TaxID=428564 RepID=A0A8D8ZDX2_9HEMI